GSRTAPTWATNSGRLSAHRYTLPSLVGGVHGRRKLQFRAFSIQMLDDPGSSLDWVGFEEEFPARQLFHILGEELVHSAAAQDGVGGSEVSEHAGGHTVEPNGDSFF